MSLKKWTKSSQIHHNPMLGLHHFSARLRFRDDVFHAIPSASIATLKSMLGGAQPLKNHLLIGCNYRHRNTSLITGSIP
jgi:hypothetical protein